MRDDDSADLLATLAGEPARFAKIVARRQSAMFRYAQSRLESRAAAEDAVQDAFLAAFANRSTFDPQKGTGRAWLWTILANVCHRAARGRRPIVALRDDVPAGDDPARHAEREDDHEQLRRRLEALPEEQAEAIRLRFFGELSFEEVGAACGCSPATAKSRVRYGLAKLASALSAKSAGEDRH